MNTLAKLALLGLIGLTFVHFWNERERKRAEEESSRIIEEVIVEEPVIDAPPEPLTVAPMEIAPVRSASNNWYVVRRLTLTHETGISGVQAGSRVERVEKDGALFASHNGRMFPASEADFTNDPMVAMRATPATAPIPSGKSLNASTESSSRSSAKPSTASSTTSAVRSDNAVRTAQVKTIDQKIEILIDRIRHENAMEYESKKRGKITARGATATRLQKEIEILQQQKSALLSR